MSTLVFKWMPHLAELKSAVEFSTLKTNYENGINQRRTRWGREQGKWSFTYKMNLLAPQIGLYRMRDEIIEFHRNRKGSYDNFFIPSWEFEGRFVSGTTTINMTLASGTTPATLGFSATVGQPGNFVCVCKNTPIPSLIDVRQITGLGASSITVGSGISSGYDSSSLVMKAYRVNFEDDNLERSWNTPFHWDKEIVFTEDIGALYI